MSVTLAAIGCCISMLSECARHVHVYLKAKALDANIASDNKDRPWIRWAADGPRALMVVAGVSCQPFSVAEKMLGGDDERAHDSPAHLFNRKQTSALRSIREAADS